MAGKTPGFISIAFIAVGIAFAVIQGLFHGSIGGGVICGLGAIPACFGMWKGIQQDTQSTLAMSVSCVLLSLSVGAVLIVLRIIHWFL